MAGGPWAHGAHDIMADALWAHGAHDTAGALWAPWAHGAHDTATGGTAPRWLPGGSAVAPWQLRGRLELQTLGDPGN